jgi:hypothetical protein
MMERTVEHGNMVATLTLYAGQIMDRQDASYTTVRGSVDHTTNSVDIRSQHHANQDVLVQLDNGGERYLSLKNSELKVRPGSNVAFVDYDISKGAQLAVIANLDTGQSESQAGGCDAQHRSAFRMMFGFGWTVIFGWIAFVIGANRDAGAPAAMAYIVFMYLAYYGIIGRPQSRFLKLVEKARNEAFEMVKEVPRPEKKTA